MVVRPLTDEDLASRRELATRSDVELLVRSFHRDAAMDELLGPIFSAAHVNWDAHIATLTDFGVSQVLGERGYVVHPLRAHEPVHARTPLCSPSPPAQSLRSSMCCQPRANTAGRFSAEFVIQRACRTICSCGASHFLIAPNQFFS